MNSLKRVEAQRGLATGLAALFAGLAMAEFAAQHPVASAEAVTPLSPEAMAAVCATDAAKLPSISQAQGLTADVLSAHSISLTVSAEPEAQAFADNSEPQCDNLSVTRSTSATVFENGHRVGFAANVLNMNNDYGNKIARTVYTGKIGCNKNIKVTFETTATTPLQPGVRYVGDQYVKFRTSC